MIKHPTREVLESGGIVDGEAFELMLKKELQSEVIKELKEINQHLMDIKVLMGYKDIIKTILYYLERMNQEDLDKMLDYLNYLILN
ncbi:MULTISPECIES: hypothetical protein [Thomasclavelia]|uniref:hypothetical protein n=1 Tax=Thomasclavelia TaxID=3025755 RepID=UPI001C387C79|nr:MULTISPECIES: hypothetical protein [Thomasclavelia]MBV3127477.1 hypothetical protein [Thomasclavelia ramosa]MBV3131378.1 hypothetical protein [Thomasclavelia ramosa]MBV3139703.1 hypothetical protein [Thomasclavelia ramosa]MBV3144869.1 hypothetical protein [Thomasclavelia ramosa]MBV3151582.1 hypothetical protein [Thomasclavelia ramosa]